MRKVLTFSVSIQAFTKHNLLHWKRKTIMHLKDEVLVAPDKLYKTERSLENLTRQYQLLQETEARLAKEREVLNREKQNQRILRANLECISTRLEGSKTKEEIRLETRLDELLSGCGVLRKRLQGKQDQFCELSYYWDSQLEAAEDYTLWKLRPPPKLKKEVEDSRGINYTEDPATLRNMPTACYGDSFTVYFFFFLL
jgi:hypothetical protein